jgi:tripartite-type tricarboxylate transporter receptor subunit TctC
MAFQTALSAVPHLQSGQLRAIAVAASRRLAQLPSVPTMAEAGFPGIGSLNWNGIFAPAATPPAVVAKIYAAIIASMKELDAEGMMAKRLIPVSLSESPDEFNAYVLSEMHRWQKIIKQGNVKLD